MAQPNQPTPERAAQGAGKSIPIEDDRPADAKAQPQARPADASGSKETPSSDAAAAEAAPQGEAIEAEVIEDAALRLTSRWLRPRRRPRIGRTSTCACTPSGTRIAAAPPSSARSRRRARRRSWSPACCPVIDDFERTIDYATKNGEGGLFDGVKAVHAKLVDVLKKDGVEVIDRPAKAFDALEAQAVATVDDASVPTRRCPRYTNEVTRWERKFSGLQW